MGLASGDYIIIRLILLELPSSDYETLVPAGLVLTGGSSNLPGIDVMAREILHLPVRIGIPTGIQGITDSLRDPAYATAVGLMLWGRKHDETPTWKYRGLGGHVRQLFSGIRNLFS